MILAIPYHPALPVDFKRFADDLTRRSGNGGHSVLVISRPEDEEAAFELAMALSSSFGRHFTAVLTKSGRTINETANMFLQTALRFYRNYRPDPKKLPEPKEIPLLYLDPCFTPTKNNWLDEIQAEYFLKGVPAVMANLKNTLPDFAGFVLFSQKYLEKSALVDFLPPNEHWKKYLRNELILNAVPTDSVGAYFKTPSVEAAQAPTQAAPTAQKNSFLQAQVADLLSTAPVTGVARRRGRPSKKA